MRADSRFLNLPLEFWANIKFISQKAGYTDKKTNQIKVHTIDEIKRAYKSNELDYSKIVNNDNVLTEYGDLITSYLKHRSDVLNSEVKPRLMEVKEAKALFEELKEKYNPTC